MKKLSLVVACVGIISAAAFANGQQATGKPQDGAKAKTEQTAPAKKHHAKKGKAAKAEGTKPAAAATKK